MAQDRFYAGGFLYNPKSGAVLLHKRDAMVKVNPNKWAFFGGLNKGREIPKETFVREIKEELNIEISPDQIVSLCDYFNERLKTYRYAFYVESNLAKSQMRLGEGAGFDWIPIDKAFDFDLTEHTRRDLEFFRRTKNG